LDPTAAYRIGRALSASDLSKLAEPLRRPCEGLCEASEQVECDRLTG